MKGDWILFVDDEREVMDAVRRDVRAWMGEQGLSAVFVSSAGEAIVELSRRPETNAVMVTDLKMPFIEGRDLLRAVALRWPDTVKIALTGTMETQFVQDFLDAGVFSYIPKPWTRERLLQDLGRAVEQRDQKRQERKAELALARDLAAARGFQGRLLDLTLPSDPRLKLDIYRENGEGLEADGDFFDARRIDKDRIILVMADASGSEGQASLVNVLIKSIMDTQCIDEPGTGPLSAQSLTESVHRRLVSGITKMKEATVALLVLELDLEANVCRWVNAGQPPFVLDTGKGPAVVRTPDRLVRPEEGERHRVNEIEFPPGSRLVLTTDASYAGRYAVAVDDSKSCFGTIISGMSAGLTAEKIAQALHESGASEEPGDYLTLVSLQRPQA
ncbi:MAG: SpoIIE family protein phosphatase [Spirochaetota bacterium]